MAFNWWDSFYGRYIGVKIHGQLGKTFIYYVVNGRQLKRRYNVQQNIEHSQQKRVHSVFRMANQKWNTLNQEQKKEWKKKDQYNPTMSGYNYFISQYLKTWYPFFPEIELQIKKVQSGIKNCYHGDTDITISSVNTANSIVIVNQYSLQKADGDANSCIIYGGYLTSSTNLRISTFIGGNFTFQRVVWQVIEYE